MISGVGRARAFTLVEVVLALGIVSFAVLAVIALLSVANETNRRAREEAFAAQLAANEFERIRAASAATFPPDTYSLFYNADLREVSAGDRNAVYELAVAITTPTTTPLPADKIVNAEVRHPVGAAAERQTKFLFTTLINLPPSP